MLSYLLSSQSSVEYKLQEYLTQNGDTFSEALLHKLMVILRGQEATIKSEFAFACLKKLITSYEINKSMPKMIRILIIFDKLVQEGYYCDEISKLALLPFDTFKGSSETSITADSLRTLRLYWGIIREKSKIINDQNHIFHQKRSQRRHYFERIKASSIIMQFSTLQSFFASIFELAYYLQGPSSDKSPQSPPVKKSEINEYILMHLLYKLLGLYNCQMMANRHLIHKMKQITEQDASKLKKSVIKFRQNCNKFINFIKRHQGERGFEHIHYQDIKVESNQKIIKFIDDSFQIMESQSMEHSLLKLPFNFGKILVEAKPMTHINKTLFSSRLELKGQDKKQCAQSNPFWNWHNSYSHQFPQKQVMSLDLILQIKLEESLSSGGKEQMGEDSWYANRCSYDNRSTNISSNYQIEFWKKEYSINKIKDISFSSCFSKLPQKWNQS